METKTFIEKPDSFELFKAYLIDSVGMEPLPSAHMSARAKAVANELAKSSLPASLETAIHVIDSVWGTKGYRRTSVNAYKCAFRHYVDFINGRPYRLLPPPDPILPPPEYLAAFHAYVAGASRRNAVATVKQKSVFAARFFAWAASNGAPAADRLALAHYVGYAAQRSSGDDWTLLRDIASFLFSVGVSKHDFSPLIVGPKPKVRAPSIYSREEKAAALAECAKRPTGVRDVCMFLLASDLGLRPSDIATLKRSDIDFGKGRISICQAKTGEPLELPMSEPLAASLERHLASQGASSNYVFLARRAPARPITAGVVSRVIAESIQAAGIEAKGRNRSARAFRSTLASELVSADVPYPVVRKILGHTDPDAITHYARIDVDRLRACAVEPPPLTGEALAFFSEAGI